MFDGKCFNGSGKMGDTLIRFHVAPKHGSPIVVYIIMHVLWRFTYEVYVGLWRTASSY